MATNKAYQWFPKNETAYYNFPVSILEGFIRQPWKTFENMLSWAAYEYMKKVRDKYGDAMPVQNLVRTAEDFLGFKCNLDEYEYYQRSGEVYLENKGARTGISRRLFWKINESGKISEPDKVALLAYLAAKSILGRKTYCKTNDLFLFARMKGRDKAFCDEKELKKECGGALSGYFTRRKRDTIRRRLAEDFGMAVYSYHQRGYYISTKMELKQLILAVEKNRKCGAEAYKKKVSEVRNMVLDRLGKKPP